MKKFALMLLVILAAFSIAASTVKAATPATTPTAAKTCDGGSHFFAKTKFVAHMAIAIGAFHRYIWKPYKAGAFKQGASGRTKAFIKAGATGLLVVHELHEACKSAQAAGGTLAKVVVPLASLQTAIGALAVKLKSGHFNPSDIASAETAITAVGG